MANLEQLLAVISDPYDNREEGVDFWVDEQGYIQTQDVLTAAMIMRTANNSGEFVQNLVKIGQRGDSILLGFDTLAEADADHTAHIGFKGDVLAEIKSDIGGKFYVYFNGKRVTRQFAKLSQAKAFVKKMDKGMQSMGTMIVTADDDTDD
jgi:hypothetical protein